MLDRPFLGGVVEGFYGRPWTNEQRKALLRQMPEFGLNSYFYAPKDDLKHRTIWRETYRDSELSPIADLISLCREQGIAFIYGLSPGLDIQFSSHTEIDRIKMRFEQLIDVGCQHFALLFDDLPGQLSDDDRRRYHSVAAAQCDVTNQVLDWTRAKAEDGRFLFCPTPYCNRMDGWRLGGDGYLETVGAELAEAIDVLWTGPEIVSREISVESVQALGQRIQRQPLIWDNLHANDYDGRRVYCGPYAGRPLELKDHVTGILINPNNEFPLNFMAFHTFGQYVQAREIWEPDWAYTVALEAWLAYYQTIGDPVSLEQLRLLADCHYLPYNDGPQAERLYNLARLLTATPVSSWHGKQHEFGELARQIVDLFHKLTQLNDRELFYAWSRRVWDLREEMDLIQAFVARKQQGDESPLIETHLPGTCRGSLVARLQTLLTMNRDGQFHA